MAPLHVLNTTADLSEHQPRPSDDFPHHRKPVCRACSYTADGIPVVPITYPCPVIVEHRAAVRKAAQQRHRAAVRLAGEVTARRTQLGLTAQQLAERAGVKLNSVTRVENASKPLPAQRTLDKLDQALGWQPGSSQRILGGGDPSLTPPDPQVPADQQIILRAGLPAEVEAALLAHMQSRRQDMEAALEAEARLLATHLALTRRRRQHDD